MSLTALSAIARSTLTCQYRDTPTAAARARAQNTIVLVTVKRANDELSEVR